MAGADDVEKGAFEGAHTAEKSAGGAAGGAAGLGLDQVAIDPERAAKVGATRATVEAALGDLAASMAGPEEGGQASLMLDEIDEQMALFAGPVRHVADTIAEARRGRGRPKGSTNKSAFRDVAMRMGYRHPGLNLLAMANADPLKLALELAALNVKVDGITVDRSKEMSRAELSGLIAAAYGIIARANAELMPFFESKAPTKVELNEQVLGVMIYEPAPSVARESGDTLDLTSFPNPE